MKYIIAILLGLIVSITIALQSYIILYLIVLILSKTEYSYAKVPKGTQQYVNITAYSERGKSLIIN